jgi:hypothetical protein
MDGSRVEERRVLHDGIRRLRHAIGLVAQFMWSGTRPSDAEAAPHVKCLNPVRLHHLNKSMSFTN